MVRLRDGLRRRWEVPEVRSDTPLGIRAYRERRAYRLLHGHRMFNVEDLEEFDH
jgi:hypothetical protein